MEADIKQQKVHNQDTIQALLLVYNRPSLKKKSGRVSFNFWLCASISCLFCFVFLFFHLLSKYTQLRFDFFHICNYR